MKNKILIIIFFFIFYTHLASEEVKDLKIYGNKRVSNETIIILGNVQKGENYDEDKINNIFKDLYSTNFFSNVEIKLKNSVLEITVVENPIIQNVILNGISAKKFSEGISDIISLKEKSSFIESELLKDVKLIRTFLQDKGFYFAEVEVFKKTNDNNSLDLVYEILLKDKVKISKINFIGEKKFKDSKLRQIITSEESKPWKFLSTAKFINEKRIQLDKRLLENYYRNKGYYTVKINSTNAIFNNTSNEFILTYNINSGKRFIVNKIDLLLPSDVDKKYYSELFNFFKKFENSYYDLRKVKKIFDKLESISTNNSLVFLETKLNETIKDDKIDLSFELIESKKLYVERINILGNSITNETVLRSALEIDEGDPFNQLLLAKSVNNLKAKNIFGSVRSNTVVGSNSELREINIEVEEKATGEISAGAGFGSSGGTVSFSIAENNWLGTGKKVETTLTLSEEKIKGRLSMNDPNFNYSGNSLRTVVESTNINKMTNFGYETTKTGFSIGTTFEQYDKFFIDADVSAYYENLSTNTTASESLKKQKGTYFDTLFSYSLISDTRNQKFQTTEGSKSSFFQRLPIYSENPSILTGIDSTHYKSFGDNYVGFARFYSRAIASINSKDVKISDRIFIPSQYLRGFEPGKVGPMDGTDYVGGNYAAALGLGLNMTNLFPQLQNTDFNLFYDAANLWHVDYDKSLPVSDSLRSAFGMGVNWFSPIGPISLSFAQDISSDDTDKTETFRFNIGTTF